MQRMAYVKRHVYYDSVTLMAAASRAAAESGAAQVLAVMATPANRELMASSSLLEVAPEAGPDDLVLVAAGSAAECERALEALQAVLGLQAGGGHAPAAETGAAEAPPRTIAAAASRLPGANLAVISVPGPYAAREARRALAQGLHVFLFSDNVPIEDEIDLKEKATDLGLLCMGPDCGTAILGGAAVGFANAVRRGPIGVVGASGTGIQAVTSLIDSLGGGISHAIGTGGRDLSSQVRGLTTLAAVRVLGADPATRVIVLVSKPPALAVARRVILALEETGKQAVVCFPGLSPADLAELPDQDDAPPAVGPARRRPADGAAAERQRERERDRERAAEAEAAVIEPPSRLLYVQNLEHAARVAVVLSGRSAPAELWGEVNWERRAEAEAARMARGQRHLRALYSGGTLCDEAMQALVPQLGPIHSNIPLVPQWRAGGGHQAIDLGDDEFTRGRPHPMLDHSLRLEQLQAAAADPGVAVVLLDVVLGYGAHADPAAVLAPGIARARAAAAQAGRHLAVVCAVIGTDRDPQDRRAQIHTLQAAGALVAPSNLQAATVAGRIAALAGARGGEER